jgi:hypothetical protein
MYPDPGATCASDPQGSFFHELVIPFIRRPRATTAPALGSATTEAVEAIQRFRPPGSEWLYAKFYGGETALDDFLRDSLTPILREAGRVNTFETT